MKKICFGFLWALLGVLAGLGLNAAICLISSYWLRLGYYAPCFVALTEPCGGELNAALVQATAFGALGGAIALLARRIRNFCKRRTK